MISTNWLSIFLSEVPLQMVNHRCSGLTQEGNFCPDPTADLKDHAGSFFRQGGIYSNILETTTVAWWSLEQPFTQVDRLLWRSLGNSRLATYRVPNKAAATRAIFCLRWWCDFFEIVASPARGENRLWKSPSDEVRDLVAKNSTHIEFLAIFFCDFSSVASPVRAGDATIFKKNRITIASKKLLV